MQMYAPFTSIWTEGKGVPFLGGQSSFRFVKFDFE